MSFYLTLPCNSSMKYYQNNVVSDYTTKLHDSIKLEGGWEVGVSKVIFRNSIQGSIGSISFYFNDNGIDVLLQTVELACSEGDSISQVLDEFAAHKSDVANKFPSEIRDAVFHLVWTLEPNNWKGLTISIKNDKIKYSFGGYLAELLNVDENEKFSKDHLMSTRFKEVNVNLFESMFIYTDIIEDQFVGDVKTKLLDT